MQGYVYNISTSYLAAIMTIGGFHTIAKASTTLPGYETKLLGLAKTREFALFSLALGVTFLVSHSQWALCVAAALVLIVVLAGAYVELSRSGAVCGCFGGVLGRSRRASILVRMVAFGAAAFVIVGPIVDQKTFFAGSHWLNFWVSAALLGYSCFVFKGPNATAAALRSEKAVVEQDAKVWKSSDFVGFDMNNERVLFSDLASPSPLLFIVAVSNSCPHCLSLLPDAAALAQAFGERINIVVVFQGELERMASGPSRVLYDPSKSLFSRVEAVGSPFALLLDSKTLRQIAPAAYGADKVRILFALALNLLVRSKQSP